MRTLAFALCLSAPALIAGHRKRAGDSATSLDQYLLRVGAMATGPPQTPSPGSLFRPNGRLADAARDLRAARAGDLVNILVSDKASAISTGLSNTARKSNASVAVTSLAGPLRAKGLLANLLNTTGNQQLQAQGTTSRQTTLTTNLTAEVMAVLPSGNLIVEGRKQIAINSERQDVLVRGIVRPEDLSPANTIASNMVGQLEISVNGKGIVGDAIKRPFILYRILLGLLPF